MRCRGQEFVDAVRFRHVNDLQGNVMPLACDIPIVELEFGLHFQRVQAGQANGAVAILLTEDSECEATVRLHWLWSAASDESSTQAEAPTVQHVVSDGSAMSEELTIGLPCDSDVAARELVLGLQNAATRAPLSACAAWKRHSLLANICMVVERQLLPMELFPPATSMQYPRLYECIAAVALGQDP